MSYVQLTFFFTMFIELKHIMPISHSEKTIRTFENIILTEILQSLMPSHEATLCNLASETYKFSRNRVFHDLYVTGARFMSVRMLF